MLSKKAEMIAALRKFMEAYRALNELWVEDSALDLNATESINQYPFTLTFEAIKIPEWCQSTMDELVIEMPKILNPICSTCISCTQASANELDDLRHCLAGVSGSECNELYIPYDRKAIINHITLLEKSSMCETEMTHIIQDGIDGLNNLTDTELLYRYSLCI